MSKKEKSSWRRPVSTLHDALVQQVEGLAPRWLGRHLQRSDDLWPGFFFYHEGPAVDVADEGNAIRVSAELPGLDKKDFELEVDEDRVILRGEKKETHEEKERDYYYSERRYGSFARTIPLPCTIDKDKATAEYKNGVLTVHLPKTEKAKTKKVEVKVE